MSDNELRRKSDKEDRGDDDDDDDEDEDEEEDEEEEEEDRARPKSKKRKSKRARLFMDEASEGEDEEEEEEGEMEEVDELPEYERQRRAERMRQEQEFAQMRPEDIALRFQERHKRDISTKGAAKFSGAATIETARLMRERPRTEDPKLFMVRCKPGEEKVLVLKLFNKYIRDKFKKPEPVDPTARKSRWVLPPPPGAELEIYSVLAPGTSGYIYVESMREDCVKAAIKGVGGIFGGSVSVVPLDEMQDVLRVDLRKDIIRKDDFVRMRGPFPYKGDLAKVHAVLEGGNKFTVKLVPRIDMSTLSMDFTSKESQKIIPPAKHFNPDEIKALNGTVGRDAYPGQDTMVDTFEDHYFENGLLLLDVSARQVQQLAQKPSLEEMERFFPPSASSNAEKDDLALIAKEMEKMAQKQKKDQFDFAVGDKVFVVAGSEAGAQGTLENVDVYRNTGSMRMGQLLIEVRLKDIVKRFALGDHVKVLSGVHKGKTGNVVNVPSISNKSVPYVIIYTDVSKEEIQVNNSDLKIASEISVGMDELNGYRLMDFVMLDQNQHGVIVRINTDSVRILMQTGEAKDLPTSAIRAKKNMDSKRATAPDMNNYPLHCQDHVVVSTGLYRGAEGVIRHIHRLLLFVHVKAREHENSGIIVVKSRDCRLAGSLQGGIAKPGAAPNRPGMPFGPSGGGAGRVRDELQGKTVRIRRGNDKGLIGVVKEGGSAGAVRVELNARNKVVIVPRDNVEVVDTRPTEPTPSAAPYSAPASDFGQSSSYGRSYMAPPPMSYAAPAQAAPTSYATPMSDFSDANRAARQAAQSNSAPQFEKGHEVTLVDTGETVKIYEVVDRDIVVIDKKGKMKIVSASNVVYA